MGRLINILHWVRDLASVQIGVGRWGKGLGLVYAGTREIEGSVLS